MFRGRDVHEIEELKMQGFSLRAISDLTGYDRKTIRKYLISPEAVPVYGPRPKPESKLDPFKEFLQERMRAGVWNAQVLLREIRQRLRLSDNSGVHHCRGARPATRDPADRCRFGHSATERERLGFSP